MLSRRSSDHRSPTLLPLIAARMRIADSPPESKLTRGVGEDSPRLACQPCCCGARFEPGRRSGRLADGSAPGSPGARARPPITGRRRHLGDHGPVKSPDASVGGVLGDLLRLVAGRRCRSVARADVVALPFRASVVDLAEELQQVAVGDLSIADDSMPRLRPCCGSRFGTSPPSTAPSTARRAACYEVLRSPKLPVQMAVSWFPSHPPSFCPPPLVCWPSPQERPSVLASGNANDSPGAGRSGAYSPARSRPPPAHPCDSRSVRREDLAFSV